MRTLVKVQPKGQMTIPRRVRSAVGLVDGDLVEVKAVGRKIVITPQLVIDRSKFPTADDEYTPAQRRAIDARLAEAEKGPFHGPFRNGAEVAAFLKKTQRSVKHARLKRDR
jgi:AbrB family looped-hinge helix DNA binding protein